MGKLAVNKNIWFLGLSVLLLPLIVFLSQCFPIELPLSQRLTLGILGMAFVLWVSEAIPLFLTSFFILFAEGTFLLPALKSEGINTSLSKFLAPFSSNLIFLFLGGLFLAEAISKYRIDKWMAKKAVNLAQGNPSYLLLAMMVTTAFLSMWMSNTATTAMMIIVAAPIISEFKDHEFSKAFYLGIPFAANFGGLGTPIGTPPNAIAIEQLMLQQKVQVTFVSWMLASLPILIPSLLLLWLCLIKFYKAPKAIMEFEHEIYLRFNLETILVSIVFVLTAFLWLTGEWHQIPTGMVALIPVLVFFSMGILEKKDFKNISWDILYLVGGGIALSVALTESGLTNVISRAFQLWDLGPVSLTVFFIFSGALLTSFMSNTATANMLIPLIFLIPTKNIQSLVLVTTMTISVTMILPVSTPPNIIAYSSGKIKMQDMALMGAFSTISAIGLILLLGKPWWNFLGITK